MTVIGLTGGIASGKSTAAGWMKELGAIVIDADRLGHRVYEPGSAGFQAVVNEFGHDLVQADGTINRQLQGGRVFGDPAQMKRLTDIVWPEIRRLAKLEVTELKRRDGKATIVLEAAVLVEANWFDLVDEVWVVTVDPAIARSRLMARNSLTEAQAQARIDSQISNKERSLHAYVKIDNSGTLDEFQQAIDKEWAKLAKRAGFVMPTRAAAAIAPVKRGAARATAPKAAAAPAAKPAAAASKPGALKSAAARPAAATPAATTTPPAAKAAVKAAPAKAVPARATATKAAAARATTRSASTQSASTRTASPRTAAPRTTAPKVAAPKAAPARAAAPRAAAAAAKATAAKVTAVKRTTAAKPAVAARPVAKPAAVATRTAAKPAASKVVPKSAPRAAAKPAARPVAARRTGAK